MSRLTTAARGYDYRHQKLRRRWARRVKTGTVPCARCGQPINPGEPWDLGHDDTDHSRHTGPEHAACNRATATHRAARRKRPVEPHPGLAPAGGGWGAAPSPRAG